MSVNTNIIVCFITVLTLTEVRCQYPTPKLECYVEQGLLKFDIRVLRNNIPFTRVYFTEQDRTELTNGECPTISGNPDPLAGENEFRATFFVDPATDLITDGRSCGIEVVETGKEYQFRVETEIEFERDRKGDIMFIYNCHADFAAIDVVSTIVEIKDPDLVVLDPPQETLRLRAVRTDGSSLSTTTLPDGAVIPTINSGSLFALQLEFVTTSDSSATGATCNKLYASVDGTYTTRTNNIIDPTTHCPASSLSGFLKPATGLKLVSTPAANSYIYRTGAIEAAKYTKVDVSQATDILYFACEAKFCREEQEAACVDPCPTVRKRRGIEVLESSDFRKMVKRNSDRVVTVSIKIQTDSDPHSGGVSMVVIWSLVGVACFILLILVCCIVVFCRARRTSCGRSNAYKHHIDASSLSSTTEKGKSVENSKDMNKY